MRHVFLKCTGRACRWKMKAARRNIYWNGIGCTELSSLHREHKPKEPGVRRTQNLMIRIVRTLLTFCVPSMVLSVPARTATVLGRCTRERMPAFYWKHADDLGVPKQLVINMVPVCKTPVLLSHHQVDKQTSLNSSTRLILTLWLWHQKGRNCSERVRLWNQDNYHSDFIKAAYQPFSCRCHNCLVTDDKKCVSSAVDWSSIFPN